MTTKPLDPIQQSQVDELSPELPHRGLGGRMTEDELRRLDKNARGTHVRYRSMARNERRSDLERRVPMPSTPAQKT